MSIEEKLQATHTCDGDTYFLLGLVAYWQREHHKAAHYFRESAIEGTRFEEVEQFEQLANEFVKSRNAYDRRKGQGKFRGQLLKAYDNKCAISDWDAVDALEAAHITPYVKRKNQGVNNGILLRADLHTLFDLDMLRIRPDREDELTIILDPTLKNTWYAEFSEKKIRLPETKDWPDFEALQRRFGVCPGLNTPDYPFPSSTSG